MYYWPDDGIVERDWSLEELKMVEIIDLINPYVLLTDSCIGVA